MYKTENDKVNPGEVIIVRKPHRSPVQVLWYPDIDHAFNAWKDNGIYACYQNWDDFCSGGDVDETVKEKLGIAGIKEDQPFILFAPSVNHEPEYYPADVDKRIMLSQIIRDDMYSGDFFEAENDESYNDFINRIIKYSGGHNEPTREMIKKQLYIENPEPEPDEPTEDINTDVVINANQEITGEIKSINNNIFTGGNISKAKQFQKQMVEKGVVSPDEDFILVNEFQIGFNGQKIKEEFKDDFVVLTIPVESENSTLFHTAKYYHTSALENLEYDKTQIQEKKQYYVEKNSSKTAEPEETGHGIINNASQSDSEQISGFGLNKSEMEQFKDFHSSFVTSAFESGTPVPDFGYFNQQSGHVTIINGYEFARLEDADSTVVLTKLNPENERIFIKIPAEQYQTVIDNSQKLLSDLNSNQTNQNFESINAEYRENLKLDEREQRVNTAANFWHNYQAGVLNYANNKKEAMNFAKRLISEMIPEEKEKFYKTVAKYEKIKDKNGKHLSYDQRILEKYDEITKSLTIKNTSIWRKYANEKENTLEQIKMYTEVFDKPGYKLDESCNLKIGDAIKLSVSVDGLKGKKLKFPPQEFKLTSYSIDTNSVALVSADGKQKIIKQRDVFIKEVHKLEKKQLKQVKKLNQECIEV